MNFLCISGLVLYQTKRLDVISLSLFSSISKVDDALKFYNDQTNLERLEEAERANSPFSSMISHNGSDLDSSFLMSPRSDSSLSNLVVTDESSPHDSRSFNEVNFPQ